MSFSSFTLLNILIAFLGLTGCIFFIYAIRSLLNKKILFGVGSGAVSLTLLSFSLFLFSVTLNLYTYNRLTAEQDVALLEIQQTGLQQYNLMLQEMNGNRSEYVMYGDEWQLDARMIKWSGLANLLGLNTIFRLERLSARYHDIQRERTGPKSVFLLSEKSGMDIWSLSKQNSAWFPWIDTVYGNATYVPMADSAKYRVSLSISGLIARPENEAARQAIQQWN